MTEKDSNDLMQLVLVAGLGYLAWKWYQQKQIPEGTVIPGPLSEGVFLPDLQSSAPGENNNDLQLYQDTPVNFPHYQEYRLSGIAKAIGVPYII